MKKSRLGIFYRAYLNFLSKLGNKESEEFEHTNSIEESQEIIFSGMKDQEIEEHATNTGDQYRSLGVLIGLLGASIVFCAITPIALSINSEQGLLAFGTAKVVLMLVMAWLVYFGQRHRIKESWITYRREAERRRYGKLRANIDDLHKSPSQENAKMLHEELFLIIAHPQTGQLAFNQLKSRKYKAIESISTRITWYGFFSALVAAVWLLAAELHMTAHRPALLFFTVFVPTLVGCIHSINGFLNIASLAEEYEKMAKFLEGICKEMNILEQNSFYNTDDLLFLAEQTYSHLLDRDLQWAESIKKVTLKPS